MGTREDLNKAGQRTALKKKKGNVFGASVNRIHTKPGTSKSAILKAIVRRHQPAAETQEPKAAPKRPTGPTTGM